MQPRSFMRHKAAASLALGYDPGAMLQTSGYIHKRGKVKWSKRQLLILEGLKSLPITERRAALWDITDRQILAFCGIYVPPPQTDPSRPLRKARAPRMGHKIGAKNLTAPLPRKAERKKYKPPKWKKGGRVCRKAHEIFNSTSPDPTESTLVNAGATDSAESDTRQEIRIFQAGHDQ